MNGFEERPHATSERVSGGVGLLGALVVLGLGLRIAAASVDVPLLSVGIVVVSAVPLLLWSRRARRDPAWLDEVSDVVRKIVGYFAAAFAVLIGTLLVLETDEWWTFPATVLLWLVGFGIVTVAFRSSRIARTLYVAAVLLFPVLMRALLSA